MTDRLRSRARAPLAALLVAVAARGAGAQRVVSSVDLSGTSVWYADSIHDSGGAISPSLRLDWSHATLGANLEIAGLGGLRVSTQGAVAPSVFTPSAGPFTAEFAGTFGGSTHEDGTHTGQMLGIVRGHFIGNGAGGWIGGGAGSTWDGSAWRGMRQMELGGWIDHGGVSTVATITPVVVADSVRYTDFQAALRYPTRAYEVGLTAGARSGAYGPAVGGSSRTWGSVSALAWLSDRLAVVATGGSYPVDFTQGFPGGRFVTLALRIASRNTRAAETEGTAAATQTTAPPPAGASATAFDIRSLGGNRRVLRVFAPAATRVEISGDFTRWEPLLLVKGADGWWSATRVIAPGTYQMNMRIDGGAWMAPPGLLTARDEFGGVVGLLTVE